MSNKDLALLLNNRVNISSDYTQLVEVCGVQAQQYEYPATNTTFANTIQVNNIVPIGALTSTLLSKNMKIKYNVTITVAAGTAADYLNLVLPTTDLQSLNTVAGGTAGGATVYGVNAGFRAFPLQSICENISISLNNNQTSWNARQTMSGLQRLLKKEALMSRAGECPCRPEDSYVPLADSYTYDQNLNVATKSHAGYTRNSLSASATGGTGPFTYTYDITEDLLIPGINSLYDNEPMLANVNNLSLILNYSNLQTDFLSIAVPYTPAALGTAPVAKAYTCTYTVAINSASLLLEYQQVDPNMVKIPRAVVYPYDPIVYFSKTITPNVDLSQAGGVLSISANSDTIRFNSLPKKIGIWVREQITNRSSFAGTRVFGDSALTLMPDKGCIQCYLGSRSGLLAQASRDEVWRLSLQAGSNQTRNDFVNGSGAFIWLDPITAFGVNPKSDVMTGENGSLNFMVQLLCSSGNVRKNLLNTPANSGFNAAVPLELIVCAMYEGQMVLTPDMCAYNTSVITQDEIDTLVSKGESISSEAVHKEINGAGLYSNRSVLQKGVQRRRTNGGVMSAS